MASSRYESLGNQLQIFAKPGSPRATWSRANSPGLLAIQESVDDLLALGTETIGVAEQADARRAIADRRIRVVVDRHPAPDPHRNVPQAASGSGVVEIEHRKELAVAEDGVERRDVVVADDFSRVARPSPGRRRRWREAG